MTAIINGVQVTGTPEEIKILIDMYNPPFVTGTNTMPLAETYISYPPTCEAQNEIPELIEVAVEDFSCKGCYFLKDGQCTKPVSCHSCFDECKNVIFKVAENVKQN